MKEATVVVSIFLLRNNIRDPPPPSTCHAAPITSTPTRRQHPKPEMETYRHRRRETAMCVNNYETDIGFEILV